MSTPHAAGPPQKRKNPWPTNGSGALENALLGGRSDQENSPIASGEQVVWTAMPTGRRWAPAWRLNGGPATCLPIVLDRRHQALAVAAALARVGGGECAP